METTVAMATAMGARFVRRYSSIKLHWFLVARVPLVSEIPMCGGKEATIMYDDWED